MNFIRYIRSLRSQLKPITKRRYPGTFLKLEYLEDRTLLAVQGVNPIVAENQLPGTPQSVWAIQGTGDPTIQGFADNISVNLGQTVNFKIDDTAAAPYQIDIYRMGYYQG